MKPSSISLFAALAVTSPLFASITINSEFGQLRDSDGTVLSSTTTLYAIVYDTDNNSSLPGGLVVNQSLTSSGSVSAFCSFAGLTLSQGLTIGGDTVVKLGTFNDQDGFIDPVLKSGDFTTSGITETTGRNYAIYWFPGVSTAVIPMSSFEVGGINETVAYTGIGNNFIGTVIPTDGALVTTAILDTDLGGNVSDPSRFTAIKTTPTFYWDTNTVTAGAQGGAIGDWNSSATNWTPGTSNYVWSGTDNDAIFGGMAGTVTISSAVAANDLTFNTTGYTITSGTLTLNGTTPTVTTGTGITATISSQIQGTAGLTKAGNGTLKLGGANSYTGTTQVNAGTLAVNGSLTDSAVQVAAGARLGGTGSISGAATTIAAGGIHAPGNSVGLQTVADISYSSGSIFEWELGSSPATTGRGTNYDAVNVTGTLANTSGAIFRIVLDGSQTFGGGFWNSARTWTDIFTTGDGNTTITNWANVFSGGFQYYNQSGVDGALVSLGEPTTEGFFTLSGSTLSWSAVPEVSNALIGALIGLGLLRRRRPVAQ